MIVPLKDTGCTVILGNLSKFPMETKEVTKVQAEKVYACLNDWQKRLYKHVEGLQGEERLLRVYGDYNVNSRRFNKLYMETTYGEVQEFKYITDIDANSYAKYIMDKKHRGTELEHDMKPYFGLLAKQIDKSRLIDVNTGRIISGTVVSKTATRKLKTVDTPNDNGEINEDVKLFYCVVDRVSGFPLIYAYSNYGSMHLSYAQLLDVTGSGLNTNTAVMDNSRPTGLISYTQGMGVGKFSRMAENLLRALKYNCIPTLGEDMLQRLTDKLGDNLSLPLLIGMQANYDWIINEKEKYVGWLQERELWPYIKMVEEMDKYKESVVLFNDIAQLPPVRVVDKQNYYGLTESSYKVDDFYTYLVDLTDIKTIKKKALAVTNSSKQDIVYRLGTNTKLQALDFMYSNADSLQGVRPLKWKLSIEFEDLRIDLLNKLLNFTDSNNIALDIVLSFERLLENGSLWGTFEALKYYCYIDAEKPNSETSKLEGFMSIYFRKSFMEYSTPGSYITLIPKERYNDIVAKMPRVVSLKSWLKLIKMFEKAVNSNRGYGEQASACFEVLDKLPGYYT